MEFLMDFLIAPAWAQDGSTGGTLASFLPLILIFVLFYFLLIRPQQKRQKEHQQMVTALSAGDEVVSGGGLLGKVTEVGEQFVTVEIASNVSVKLQKHTISSIVPKGTVKSA
jgi:preprotein translocase subunit YajC